MALLILDTTDTINMLHLILAGGLNVTDILLGQHIIVPTSALVAGFIMAMQLERNAAQQVGMVVMKQVRVIMDAAATILARTTRFKPIIRTRVEN
jgi:hypothetical protein